MKKIHTVSVLAVVSLAAYAGVANSRSDDSAAAEPTSWSLAALTQATQSAFGLLDAPALPAGDTQTADASPLLRFGTDQLPRIREWLAAEPTLTRGTTTTDAVPCTGGGSITYSYTVPSQGADLLGGRYTLRANQCVEQIGTIHGVLVATFQQWNRANNGYSYQARLEYQNLSIRSADGSLAGNGPLTLDYAENFASGHSSTGMTTPSFAVTTVSGAATYSRTLKNYSTSYHDSTARSTARTVASSAFDAKLVQL